MAIFCQIAILALLSLCIHFKNFFGKMTFGWVLWKSHYTLFPKKCLWPCPGPSMYLSERINWIISSFPHTISKILSVLGSWNNSWGLGCRIGSGYFFWYLNSWKNAVDNFVYTKDLMIATCNLSFKELKLFLANIHSLCNSLVNGLEAIVKVVLFVHFILNFLK